MTSRRCAGRICAGPSSARPSGQIHFRLIQMLSCPLMNWLKLVLGVAKWTKFLRAVKSVCACVFIQGNPHQFDVYSYTSINFVPKFKVACDGVCGHMAQYSWVRIIFVSFSAYNANSISMLISLTINLAAMPNNLYCWCLIFYIRKSVGALSPALSLCRTHCTDLAEKYW